MKRSKFIDSQIIDSVKSIEALKRIDRKESNP
ncbi:hypothetical protein MCEMIEM12_01780 [Burkholderiaceae bacterium]